jgi:DNA-binding GntR family transcriptional regulator
MDNEAAPGNGLEVANWLRERIRKGRFVPGQRLVEIDIIQMTGTSRAKIREAFQRLEAEGLVLIEEFRGASVRQVSIEEVGQIYRARIALEGISAADCATFCTDQQMEKLQMLQSQLDATVDNKMPEQFGQLNHQWHSAIIAGSGNKVVAQTLDRLSVPINRMLFESFYDAERLRTANADHQKITAAILARNSLDAEMHMRRHVEEGFKTLSSIAREFS